MGAVEMRTQLQAGETVHLATSGIRCRVSGWIGSGGEGEVYEVVLDDGRDATQPYALKWYHPHTATSDRRARLSTLVQRGNPDRRFLWPIDLAVGGNGTFGYVMQLRQQRYRSIVDVLTRRSRWSGRAIATAGYELADAFRQLHAQGLCYRDISFGNVFLDPSSGDILVCDNDNVGVDGSEGAILGTLRFMAPEIITGAGQVQPSAKTDLFSLAVLLFYLCIGHHPLEGALELDYEALDTKAMMELFGAKATFVFDPANRANAPVPGHHDRALRMWEIVPSFLRDRFTEAFTAGLWDPNARVVESFWKRTMVTLRDAVVDCPHCGSENFSESGAPVTCWACGRMVTPNFVLRVGNQQVILNRSTQLFGHHLGRAPFDFSAPLAEVASHPADDALLGLRNLGRDAWVAVAADGEQHDVLPGRSIRLVPGLRIEFGSVAGVVA
jgi:DNA-binding helix-hairpin-helix protein with protein kinase domain